MYRSFDNLDSGWGFRSPWRTRFTRGLSPLRYEGHRWGPAHRSARYRGFMRPSVPAERPRRTFLGRRGSHYRPHWQRFEGRRRHHSYPGSLAGRRRQSFDSSLGSLSIGLDGLDLDGSLWDSNFTLSTTPNLRPRSYERRNPMSLRQNDIHREHHQGHQHGHHRLHGTWDLGATHESRGGIDRVYGGLDLDRHRTGRGTYLRRGSDDTLSLGGSSGLGYSRNGSQDSW